MLATLENAFPKLSEHELELLEPLSICQEFADGEFVFRAGDPTIDLYVVETGFLDILNPCDSNKVIVTHEPGHFSGDIDLLIRRPPLISGVARGRTRVLRVPQDRVHEVLVKIPNLSDRLMTAFHLRREILSKAPRLGLKVFGPIRCRDTTVLREFLFKNFVPFVWLDPELEGVQKELKSLEGPLEELEKLKPASSHKFPVVECPSGQVLLRPTLRELATAANVWHHCPSQTVDLVVIGAGPAGLAAAIYASSEGVSTLVIDKLGPGGQAGGSSKIENFIGFPAGLTGAELAMRSVLQMLKFGATLVAPAVVESIEMGKGPKDYHLVHLDCGAAIHARVILIATGVTWRKLDAENAERFERQGIYYACTSVEALVHDREDVAVVGAGNSAGQAAVYLADCCPNRTVHIMARGKFGPSMSDYLNQRIAATPNIRVHENTHITTVNGDMNISSVEILSNGKKETLPIRAVFVFIGAEPGCDWLPKSVKRDEKGFVLTGSEVIASGHWPITDRTPCPLETSVPGLLAAGDIRSGSTKRVGFAVGDGSLAITCVHHLMSKG